MTPTIDTIIAEMRADAAEFRNTIGRYPDNEAGKRGAKAAIIIADAIDGYATRLAALPAPGERADD